ncbi:unnamed protein product [Brassica rapa]|uniref:Glucosidase II beta subunit N-terminal domain-containing protein n=1 Tax=Brassica campestris TaxID=3711 RepID=A0A8D9FXP8_BRACM|nr:unnamed protein product [Brassica rapa]
MCQPLSPSLPSSSLSFLPTPFSSPQDEKYYKSSSEIKSSPNGKFYCQNDGHSPLVLFSSRVNDGICADCCDGIDEYDGQMTYSNTCWEAGKAARENLKKKIETYNLGVVIRKKEIALAKVGLEKDEAKLKKLKSEEKILKGLVYSFHILAMCCSELESQKTMSFKRSRNAGRARRQCTLWSFSQLMVSLFTSLASSALIANPPFNVSRFIFFFSLSNASFSNSTSPPPPHQTRALIPFLCLAHIPTLIFSLTTAIAEMTPTSRFLFLHDSNFRGCQSKKSDQILDTNLDGPTFMDRKLMHRIELIANANPKLCVVSLRVLVLWHLYHMEAFDKYCQGVSVYGPYLDDPLQILYAIRFGARFGFILDEELKQAASSEEVRVALGEKISKEEIGNEIDLMISGDGVVSVVTYLSDLKLFGVVFALPSSSEPAPSENFSSTREMERKEIPKAHREETGEKGCFITNMHCMSCNPEFEQLLRYLY